MPSSTRKCLARDPLVRPIRKSNSVLSATQTQDLRARHGLCALFNIKLGEDVLHVRLHRFGSDGEVPGNLLVGESLGNHLEYIAFACTQWLRNCSGRYGSRGLLWIRLIT